ncbi:IS481 family transposase [Leptospira ellisii]|uniref:IS481 family transposase n=1 Tax=Leptospira ellisii TaxID=2023197 RepID=A0A2N0B5L6_9LEPT|nr:IS481 family transposase [Leptospira ellisii]MDV6236283.1 IS481 family transposase [Leptospira ellisii]PJZ91844.1 IS481 family transposase [Leptospira ellisii]PKA04119.1 IS481 family transposase [Leptospira ellisii]
MPWKETCVHQERMKFVIAWKQGGWSITDLCKEFGISRVTGYKYLSQYELFGIDGLKDKPRIPKSHPKTTKQNIVQLVVSARDRHPNWGARKLLASLKGKFPKVKNWPSVSTVGRILKRKGLTTKVKVRRKKMEPVYHFSHVLSPNDVWCADFKGHFTVGDGMRCTPLTITDAYSRFLLGCEIVPKANTESVISVFTKLFTEYGLPDAIRTDNGSPFASLSLAGLTKLSVWWLKLGIRLERIEPGKPQQNGRHERMHRTLKQETALPPRSSLEEQQKAFDDFQYEYNCIRPHEALKNAFPKSYYKESLKTFPSVLPEAYYPTNVVVTPVNDLGNIYFAGHRIFLSSALADESVGLEDISDRHVRIIFHKAVLGVIDSFTGKVLQYKNPMPIH